MTLKLSCIIFFQILKFIRIINLELIRTFSKVENKLQKYEKNEFNGRKI